MSVICGSMFGEKKVKDLVALLSRFWLLFQLVKFSVSRCNFLSLWPFTKEDFIFDCHASTGARQHSYAALRATCCCCCFFFIFFYFLWDVQLCTLCLAANNCNARLNVIERSHAYLACFVFKMDQHFVGSACIAGLCYYSC